MEWNDLQKRKNLEDLLMKKENIEYLESALNKDASLAKQVFACLPLLKFGPVVKKKSHLKSIYDEVRPAVHQYLGVEIKEEPKLSLGKWGAFKANMIFHAPVIAFYGDYLYDMAKSLPQVVESQGLLSGALSVSWPLLCMGAYYSLVTAYQDFFRGWSKRINVGNHIEEEAKVTLVHEYTHFVQHHSGFKSRILAEGHARGVERKFAEMYAKADDNKIYLVGTVSKSMGELKTEYSYLCKRLGVKEAEWAKSVKGNSKSLLRYPSAYAKGVSLFRIAEEKFPDSNVYAEAVKKDLTHLLI